MLFLTLYALLDTYEVSEGFLFFIAAKLFLWDRSSNSTESYKTIGMISVL